MLSESIAAVSKFMAAKLINFKQRLGAQRNDCQHTVFIMRQQSVALLRQFNTQVDKDYRLIKTHLILEEVSELTEAIMRGDEEATLDALADSIYVIIGAAITFDLPLAEAFNEVQRSNMSKTVNGGSDPRLADKGATYSPPDLAGILVRYRERQNQNDTT